MFLIIDKLHAFLKQLWAVICAYNEGKCQISLKSENNDVICNSCNNHFLSKSVDSLNSRSNILIQRTCTLGSICSFSSSVDSRWAGSIFDLSNNYTKIHYIVHRVGGTLSIDGG